MSSPNLSLATRKSHVDPKVLGAKYLVVGTTLAGFIAVLSAVLSDEATPLVSAEQPRALIEPMVALAGLTGLVWLLMVLYRNLAFIRGKVSERYFQTYTDAPAE